MRPLLIILAVVLLFGWSKDHNEMQARIDATADDASESASLHESTQDQADHAIAIASDLEKRLATEHANCEKLVAAATNLEKDKDALIANCNEAAAEVKRLKAEPHSCPLPPDYLALKDEVKELREFKAEHTPKTAPKKRTKLQRAIDDAADSHKPIVAVFRQDVCGFCDSFEANVTNRSRYRDAIERDWVLCELNTDHDDISGVRVHQTPAVGIYDPKARKWLTFFTPSQSGNGFLRQLDEERGRL